MRTDELTRDLLDVYRTQCGLPSWPRGSFRTLLPDRRSLTPSDEIQLTPAAATKGNSGLAANNKRMAAHGELLYWKVEHGSARV